MSAGPASNFNYSGRRSVISSGPTPLPVWHRALRRLTRQNSAGLPWKLRVRRGPFHPQCTSVVFTPQSRVCCEFVTYRGAGCQRPF